MCSVVRSVPVRAANAARAEAGDHGARLIHKDGSNRGERKGWRKEAGRREKHPDCHASGDEPHAYG